MESHGGQLPSSPTQVVRIVEDGVGWVGVQCLTEEQMDSWTVEVTHLRGERGKKAIYVMGYVENILSCLSEAPWYSAIC